MRLRRRHRPEPAEVLDLHPLVEQIKATALDVERSADRLAASAERVRDVVRELMQEVDSG